MLTTIEPAKPSFAELEQLVIQWAKDRRIIPNAKPYTQLLKAVSELGELFESLTIAGEAEFTEPFRDAVGDTLVCLINYCALKGIPQCGIPAAEGDFCNLEEYQDEFISEYLTTVFPAGKKDVDWDAVGTNILSGLLKDALDIPIAIGDLADAEAKCLSLGQIADRVGNVLIALIQVSSRLGFRLSECLAIAYDTIKDRKGYLTPDGTYVKEE